jgi:hypothetical protein
MCPSDFKGEIEDEDAVCVGANIGCRYPCLCPVFMRDVEVKIHEPKGARLPVEAGRIGERRRVSFIQIGYR